MTLSQLLLDRLTAGSTQRTSNAASRDVRERVRAAVEARGEPDLERAYRRLFD